MTQTQPPVDEEAISPVEAPQPADMVLPGDDASPELDYIADTAVEEATTQQPLVNTDRPGGEDQPTPDTPENEDTGIQGAVEHEENTGPAILADDADGQAGDMRWDDRDDESKDLSENQAEGIATTPPPPEPEPDPSKDFEPGGRASGIAGRLLAIAKTQLGVPYVYAGTAWGKGMDCSGFIQQVFARVGINLPRDTYSMQRQGQRISSLAEAKPGDLIFTTGDIGMRRYGHAGIYLGNGMYIVAPRTGKNIQIQSLAGRALDDIRRYF